MAIHHPYIRGVFWSLMASAISAFNDLLSKKMGMRIGGGTTLFFRFFFSAIIFLPYVLWHPSHFKTSHHGIHAMRGGMFTIAMLPWYYGLIRLPLPLITIISFATPLFASLLSVFWLKESLNQSRKLALFVGFLGIVISTIRSRQTGGDLNLWALVAVGATFLFALLDVMNKRLLNLDEKLPSMVFYSALWTSLFSLPFALCNWATPTVEQIGHLALLGLCANIFLACLLKAAHSVKDLSSLQPLRYTEFVFSCLFSIIFFHQFPKMTSILGMVLIVPSAIYLTRQETQNSQ